jgi:hypothetical protein
MTNNNDERIIAFEKNKSKDDCISVGELLTALKGDVFSSSIEKAPVIIHSFDIDEEDDEKKSDIHLLKIVLKCEEDALQLEAGEVKPDDIRVDENTVIYSDYTHSRHGFISRKELIEILEKFISKNGSDKKVEIRTSDDFMIYPLTEIFKCSTSCPSVHLNTGYFDKK